MVIAAVLQSGEALRYASNELRNDIDVVLSAIFQDGKALECASDVLKNNKEVVLAAIGQNLSALQFAGSKIRQNIIIQLAITIYDNQPVDIENLSIRKILKAWYSHLNYHLNFPVFIKIIEIFNHSTLQNFEKKQLLKSMFDLMGSLKDEVIQSDSASRIIHAIFTLANLSGRRALIKEFNQLSVNELNAISAQPSKEITNRTQFELRIKVLLARLNSVSGNSIFSLDIAETLYLNFLKDTKMQLVLFSYLEIVINSYSKLPQSQKDTLIGWLKNNLNKPLQPHMIKKFKLLTSIEAIFGSGAMIEVNNKSLEEIEAYFAKAFNKLFHGASIIQDADLSSQLFFRYQETFAQFREPMAIFAYLQSVKQVEPIVYKALTEYVYHVLKGDFDQFRNKHIEDQPHLANLYQKPDIKELWLAHPQSLELTDSGITEAIDIIHFFHQKVVVDNHFQDEDASKPSVLKEYLKQAAKNATIDHQPYLRMLEENKAQLALHTSSDTILLVRNRLELLIIKFCSKEVDLDTFKKEREALYTNRLVRKNEVEKVLSNDFELLYQQSLLDMPGGKHNVQFTTDPNDLFLLGTEVQGSCQNIYGTPNLNKCLLGYMINGESQAIVIKDRLNRIVGRGIVRLLSDDKDDPVLFLERLYLNKQLDSWKEAIISMAKEKAKMMKLPLLSKEVGKGEPVEDTLYFRGGRAPFIYSDASGGVLNGQEGFKITGAHILFKSQ